VKCWAIHERQTEVPRSYSEIQRDIEIRARYREIQGNLEWEILGARYKKIVDRKSRGNRGRIMEDKEKS
jgi:hypothetical protein